MNRNLEYRDYNETEERGGKPLEYKYVSYDPASDSIDIKARGGLFVYDVPMIRCKSAGQCLDWIHQLHFKTWFHAEMEKEFIDLLLKLIPSDLWSGGGK